MRTILAPPAVRARPPLLPFAAVGTGIAWSAVATRAPAPEVALTLSILAVVAFFAFLLIGRRRLATAFLLAGVLTMTWNGVRLAGWATLSDGLLVVALLLSLPEISFPLRQVPRSPIYIAVFLIVFGGIAGTIFATTDSAESTSRILRFGIASVGMLFLVSTIGRDYRKLNLLLAGFIGSTVASTAFGMVMEGGMGRIDGLAIHPNHLAQAQVLSLGPLIVFWSTARGMNRFGLGAMVVLLSLGVLDTGSRGSLIGTIALVGLAVVLLKSGRVAVLAGAGTIAMVLVLIGIITVPGSNAFARLLYVDGSGSAASDAGRAILLQKNLDLVSQSPILGRGFENVLEAHNIYIQLLVGAGVFGLMGAGLLVASTVSWLLVRPTRPSSIAVLGCGLGFFGFLVAGLVQNQLWDRFLWFLPAVATHTFWIAKAGTDRDRHSSVTR